MNLEVILTVAVIYLFVREALYIYTVNKLVNKLMARNYYEYRLAENVGKKEEPSQNTYDEDLPEDLRPLAGIG